MSSLEPPEYVVGQVIDALFVAFIAELYKNGIKVVIIPEFFFTRVAEDVVSKETFIPYCQDVDFIVAASYHSHH